MGDINITQHTYSRTPLKLDHNPHSDQTGGAILPKTIAPN